MPVIMRNGVPYGSGGITVELTQAEYDAMVSVGTVDPNTNYLISDGLSVQVPIDDNSISTEKVWSSKKISESQAIYSTEERVVGTWISGKPIYQRTWTGLSFGTTKDNWTNVGITIENVEQLIWGVSYQTSSKRMTPNYIFRMNNNDVQYYIDMTFTAHDIATLQYTKTTDPTPT